MENIKGIAGRCLNCRLPGCVNNCPCGNRINEILSAVKVGDEGKAVEILYSTNPFPLLTSPLCDHARQCRGHCVFVRRGNPIDFPSVERCLGQAYPFPYVPKDGALGKVAIIGAGPASLSAAHFLINGGFAVEIYEKNASIGGAISTGIPVFRYDKSPLEDIYQGLRKAGVVFRFSTEVDKGKLLSLKDDFDEVIIATGASKENTLPFPPSSRILQALPLLKAYNENPDAPLLPDVEKVVVMGGGNVAMDISRTLKRKGKEVTLIYRRDEASMPAQMVEIQQTKEDGVEFQTLTNAISPILGGDFFKGLCLVRMNLGEPDESGRPSFHQIEGSEFDFPCDAFVMAIGEKSDVSDQFGDLGEEFVLIGDCKYGAKNIASAIADGRETAKKIIGEHQN